MKIPSKINVKTALIFVGISILLTSALFYAFATTPSSTFYISSGVYPGAPSFTIWRESSNYFAKNANGQIGYSGTNFTAVFTSAQDNLPIHGGVIKLKSGYYEGWIFIHRDGVFVEGEGSWATQVNLETEPVPEALYGTVIKPPSGKNGIEIGGWDSGEGVGENDDGWKYGIQIRDLGIWFTTASTGHGITTGTPYNKTTVTNLVVENIKVLGHDENHYALQLCNFLYSTFKNILAWGGGLLEIYANSAWLHQGNSIFDQLFLKVTEDFNTVEHVGVYPIFIHRNGSIGEGNTFTNLCNFRRIQVNNPVTQTGAYFYEAYIHDLRYSTFLDLNLEGVNGNKIKMGTAHHVDFIDAYMWALNPADSYLNVASNTEYIKWDNCYLEDIVDGNITNLYVNCEIVGDIDPNTQAAFINLVNNSGVATLSGASVTVDAKFIGPNDYVVLTIIEADSVATGDFIKVDTINNAPTNTFVVNCGDEGAPASAIVFYWEIKHASP